MSLIATALLPFVLQFADGALRGADKAFICTNPQTNALTVNETGVRRVKQLDASGVWQITYAHGRKAIVQIDPSHNCRIVK